MEYLEFSWVFYVNHAWWYVALFQGNRSSLENRLSLKRYKYSSFTSGPWKFLHSIFHHSRTATIAYRQLLTGWVQSLMHSLLHTLCNLLIEKENQFIWSGNMVPIFYCPVLMFFGRPNNVNNDIFGLTTTKPYWMHCALTGGLAPASNWDVIWSNVSVYWAVCVTCQYLAVFTNCLCLFRIGVFLVYLCYYYCLRKI